MPHWHSGVLAQWCVSMFSKWHRHWTGRQMGCNMQAAAWGKITNKTNNFYYKNNWEFLKKCYYCCILMIVWSDRVSCSRCWCFWNSCPCWTDEMQGLGQRTLKTRFICCFALPHCCCLYVDAIFLSCSLLVVQHIFWEYLYTRAMTYWSCTVGNFHHFLQHL